MTLCPVPIHTPTASLNDSLLQFIHPVGYVLVTPFVIVTNDYGQSGGYPFDDGGGWTGVAPQLPGKNPKKGLNAYLDKGS